MLNLWMTKLKQEILSHRKESPVQFSLYLMNSIPCKHVNSLRDGPMPLFASGIAFRIVSHICASHIEHIIPLLFSVVLII